ncbi:hypothetical protein [Methylobacterium aerolatum]|uniref:Uncharacterized protein n=1 Tax=Methylobacterium aerolatum TaxID=418708 RepID=A0ABU0HZY9_9HYPH|nr:hypothetical protein [Methylobacterium aerolatum]MDQ0447417.1 hypothetical protein [Methylobacterium aerolatum]GJD34168.1 hypothetical protein FMGBMHLM_1064 [Methylobacterium aerolatum]
MNTNPPHEHCLSREFDALLARVREQRDAQARHDLFTALLALERRAGVAEVSDRFLRQISEARFLAGILRESVAPIAYASPLAARRALGPMARTSGAQDLDAVNAA